MKKNILKLLNKVYFDGLTGAYSSIDNLLQAARLDNRNVTRKDVKEFLKNNYTYLRFKKPSKIPKGQRKWITTSRKDIEVDLAKFGNKWYLVAYVPYSSLVETQLIGSKSSKSTATALRKIFDRIGANFKYVRSDRGKVCFFLFFFV